MLWILWDLDCVIVLDSVGLDSKSALDSVFSLHSALGLLGILKFPMKNVGCKQKWEGAT